MRNTLRLNKYKVMWMFVFFDLPVVEPHERKAATDFRNFLLDCGFSMAQYSVYIRVFSGSDACEKYFRKIEEAVPSNGRVEVVTITDRQYENIKCYYGPRYQPKKNQPDQLLLF